MSKFETSKVMPRYFVIAVILTLVGIAVVIKASVIMTSQRDYWAIVAKQQKNDSIPLPSTRGNILSSDGQLMASTLPNYRIYVDFQSVDPKDTTTYNKMTKVWSEEMDSLCIGLSQIFPEHSAEHFKKYLLEGRNTVIYDKKSKTYTTGHRNWPIVYNDRRLTDSLGRQRWIKVPRRIDYNTFCAVKQLPIFREGMFKSGFHYEIDSLRSHPFGSLAQRTVGDVYAARNEPRFGLELSFDSLLRGTTGLKRRQKVLYKTIDKVVAPAIDGADIVTTIDVYMQDLAEKALLDEMRDTLTRADMGVAIVMEVATGDVKAIVNMERTPSGNYREQMNNAVAYLCEPGSVFKTASVLVALDDGVCDTTEVIHSGNGILPFGNRLMKDHNWRKGGYGDITVGQSIAYSSNVGVSHIINKYYGKNPKKYVEGIYRTGIADSLPIPIKGYHVPNIRMPDPKATKPGEYWSSTTLPWMSIGYETQIAPINTLTFYNAIANGGRMMRPRFVKAVQKDGQVVREFPPVAQREQIAKPQTIKKMQELLRGVVTYGTAKKVMRGSLFTLAGKTGTAQIADQHGGYHSGTTRYWLSFAGFFPYEKPRYSCIVCLRKKGLPASGGMSARVFRNIAEGVLAQDLKVLASDARDTASVFIPDVKNGDLDAADYVLQRLHVSTTFKWDNDKADMQNPLRTPWGKALRQDNNVVLVPESEQHGIMPDLAGMGARDAVFLMEQMGARVRISGCGRVKSQSIAPGHHFSQGSLCLLQLE